MKICRYTDSGAVRTGVIEDGLIREVVGCSSLLDVIGGATVSERSSGVPLSRVKILAPLPDAPNLYAALGITTSMCAKGGRSGRIRRGGQDFLVKLIGQKRLAARAAADAG